ncbi:SDR family NAD(P)-dependent oxidoreductase [Streptomyces gibsoniae]|uniref:SDR family oxidoreductase n=1 Tax=Streptomyces gibsoniae TaxID=3075529 RepID=A0ABU2U1Z9_9ACTN|nr:SDR family oxidoreductase [Streptomyces sp. DSM 41699]MDT0467203.1 SDR family oxidoreductase [Streptomyces sp. DSM 41699]
MDQSFEGTTALVTGGGTGIGRASALALAAARCTVTVAGRTVATLEETVRLIADAGGAARHVECDVSDEQSVAHAVQVAVGDSGRLDFGVNSAGISGGDDLRKLADYPVETFDRMIATDLRGTFLSMKHQLRQMRAQGFGSIVNVGSGASVVGVAGFAGYTAAKHGVIGLTRTAALDYGPDGIRVNALVVGLVNTPLIAEGRSPEVMAARVAAHPIGRIAEPEEIADAVLWLCSDRSGFVTGAALPVDGGYTAR